MTTMPKAQEISRKWYIIDAANRPLGRTAAAAAAILLLVGISGIYRHLSPAPANYVIIDGKEYTDVHLIREQAMVAFRDVSLSEEEVFATLFDE